MAAEGDGILHATSTSASSKRTLSPILMVGIEPSLASRYTEAGDTDSSLASSLAVNSVMWIERALGDAKCQ